MDRIRGIYQGFLALSFMFLLAASFIYISLMGYCTEDWLPRNVAIGIIAEVILFVWAIILVKNGSAEIWEKCHNIRAMKDLYVRILLLMGFGMLFSMIMLFIPYGAIGKDDSSDSLLIYVFNIFIPSLFFFIWMCVKISKINRILEH